MITELSYGRKQESIEKTFYYSSFKLITSNLHYTENFMNKVVAFNILLL